MIHQNIKHESDKIVKSFKSNRIARHPISNEINTAHEISEPLIEFEINLSL